MLRIVNDLTNRSEFRVNFRIHQNINVLKSQQICIVSRLDRCRESKIVSLSHRIASHRIALHRAKVQVCGARGSGELAEGKRTILLQYEALERWNSQHWIIMSRIIAQKVLKKFTRLFVVWFLWLVCRCRLHGGLCDGGLTLSGYMAND
jgi:hypothetical protein